MISFSLLETLRVLSWISCFLSNSGKDRLKGPLTTNELLKERKLIIRKVQLHYSDTETFKINKKQLIMKVSEEGLHQCFGSLLNCTPCVPSHLRVLPIIDTRLKRLCAYAFLPSSIGALPAFVLSCYKYRFAFRPLYKKF